MDFHLARRAYKGPSTAAARLIRNRIQEEHAKQSWYFIGSVIFFFTAVRALRYLARISSPQAQIPEVSSPKEKEIEAVAEKTVVDSLPVRVWNSLSTAFRIVFFRFSIPIGPNCIASLSELAFIWVYMASMLVWLFVDTHDLWTIMYQDRAAHLATVQLPLVVALAGKNNIISWLTGISHERLNVLHRAAARTCLLFAWIHAITRVMSGLPAQFSLDHNWMRAGATGLTAFTIATMLSVRPIRNAFFEFFLISHVVLILIFLVSVFFHAQNDKHGYYIWPALVVWGFDRVLRLGRLIWNNRIWVKSSSGDALVELVSDDTIRLTLQRRVSWTPGQHAYVVLPSVSNLPIEAHPFSIASIVDPKKKEQDVVFLIRGRTGFTKRLREHAANNRNSRVPAFLDGPYGCPPDLKHYSTCILIAGGSGISYTLPLLLDLVKANAQGKACGVRRIVFVWTVRDSRHLTWISTTLTEALAEATSSLAIEPRVYITGKSYPIPEVPALPTRGSDASDSEKKFDIVETELPVYSTLKLIHGRPSIKKLLYDEISLAAGPVSVDVAGPSSLTESIRKTLSTDLASPLSVLKGAQPVTLHVETFGMAKK